MYTNILSSARLRKNPLILQIPQIFDAAHSLIRGILIQSCPARAKNFTNHVFCHVQFCGVILNIENHCAIRANFEKTAKMGQNGTTIFNILDNTTKLWMTKYMIGEIFSSSGATLYKNPSDQTV